MRHKMCAIARVIKTHGKQGEVVCAAAGDLPFLIEPGMKVVAVPPLLKGPRELSVKEVEYDGRAALITFEELHSISDAEAHVGKTLLAKREDLPHDFELLVPDEILGLDVEDENQGSLGTLVEVMAGPTQDVWVLENEAGQRLMVPILDEVILGFKDSDTILIAAKAGSIMIDASASN